MNPPPCIWSKVLSTALRQTTGQTCQASRELAPLQAHLSGRTGGWVWFGLVP